MIGRQDLPFLEARLGLKETEYGGRLTSIKSGYRCPCNIGHAYGGIAEKNDAAFNLVDTDELRPGDSAIVHVIPTVPDAWSHLVRDSIIELHEGDRVIGVATVLNPLKGSRK